MRSKEINKTSEIEDSTSRIEATINGERRSLPTGITVSNLIKTLDIPNTRVAVEKNHKIVPKSQFNIVQVGEGDKIEIVSFIGGG